MAKRKALSKRTRFEVFKRDGFTCRYCAQKPPEVMLVVDHVVPVVEGGTDDPANLATACQTCNQGKAGVPLGVVQPPTNNEATLELAQELAEQRHTIQTQYQQQQSLDEVLENAAISLLFRWDALGGMEEHFDLRGAKTIIRAGGVRLANDAIDVTGAWWDRNPHRKQRDAWKYFCGVAWGMIRRLTDGK